MSARERLIEELSKLMPIDRATYRVDAFAHELAEEIRAMDPVEAALAGQRAWSDAADLIDPMKEGDRGQQ